jgi:uncharacterized protein (UPF0276 family)
VAAAEDAVAAAAERDRIGLAWRPELAAGLHEAMAFVDALEVIADNWFHASSRELSALAALGAERPLLLHGVGMGLASAFPVARGRAEAMARLVERVRPAAWSEHLAFVRAGDLEIGHLAAPPRSAETIEGTLENLERVRRVVGSPPWLENVATLVDPPFSSLTETAWTARVFRDGDADMLLDLHNLYANALNFRTDPFAMLREMPLERVRGVHLSGGRWTDHESGGRPRLLDDHLHDPPDAVYDLLTALARDAPQPLFVIIERDGCYPAMDSLLLQIGRARAALATGRAARQPDVRQAA